MFDLEQHPAIKYVPDTLALMKPLQAHGINYFCHSIRDLERSSVTGLCSHPDWTREYISEKYTAVDFPHVECLMRSKKKVSVVLYDVLDGQQDGFDQLYESAHRNHGIGHLVAISYKLNDGKVAVNFFGSPPESRYANQVYISQVEELVMFSELFRSKILSQKEIVRAIERTLEPENTSIQLIDSHLEAHLSGIHHDMTSDASIKRFYLSPLFSDRYITQKELICLMYLHQGLSVKQVACEMCLSARTIEEYVSTLKRKLNCHSLYQLGSVVSQLCIYPLILRGFA